MNPKLVEEVARAMCFQDSPSHVWHCDPDALKEPPNWKRGASGDLDERMTNWEVRAYMAQAAIRVCMARAAEILSETAHRAAETKLADDADLAFNDSRDRRDPMAVSIEAYCAVISDAIKREGGLT